MTRAEFHKLFKCSGPVVLPVIHALDVDQVERNIRIVKHRGVPGLLLINHDIPVDGFIPIICEIRGRFPFLWMGVNFLAVTGLDAFPILGQLQQSGIQIDAYWADDARIDEKLSYDEQVEAAAIAKARRNSGWNGLYLGGTCFKKQREVSPEYFETAARIATNWMDVVTTSGVATGRAPDLSKVSAFRRGAGEAPLALASGITPVNAASFSRDIDCFIIGTGINIEGDFYNFDPQKVEKLMRFVWQLGEHSEMLLQE